MIQLDTYKGEAGEYEGLLRSTGGIDGAASNNKYKTTQFTLGTGTFAKQFASQYKESLLKEGQVCIFDSSGGHVTVKTSLQTSLVSLVFDRKSYPLCRKYNCNKHSTHR